MPFAPVVDVEPSTRAPKARAALVATVTQAAGESAISSMRIEFPKAFGFNERFRPPRCQPDDEEAMTCPAASRIGSVEAVSSLSPATGDVYITDDFRLVAFAEALGGLLTIKATGTIDVTRSGGFAVTFGGLPDLPLRSVRLALDGGRLALLKNPVRCRTYRLPASFKSHQGETSGSVVSIAISGCRPSGGGK